MVKALVEGLDEGQQKILVKSLLNLRTFFDSYKKIECTEILYTQSFFAF